MKSARVVDGIEYTKLGVSAVYLSTDKHRHKKVVSKRGQASSWKISRDDEALSFVQAFQAGDSGPPADDIWYLERGRSGLVVLGTSDENIALFQVPSSEQAVWHGHPRGHRGRDDYPSVEVLRGWKKAGRITTVEFSRMLRGNMP